MRGKMLLKESYHFILSSLMVAIYTQTDKMMIGSMINDMSAVGLYSVSVTIMQSTIPCSGTAITIIGCTP